MQGAIAFHTLDKRLDQALSAIFRPMEKDGFWDPERGTFTKALDYRIVDGTLEWEPNRAQHWRYGPFGLLGTMRWRSSSLGTDEYDLQLRRALDHAAKRIEAGALQQLPNYGLGALLASFGMAGDVFQGGGANYTQVAQAIYDAASPLVPHSHSEDVLLTYGASVYHETAGTPESAEDIEDAVADIASSTVDRKLAIGKDSRPGWSRYGTVLTRAYDLVYGGSRPLRHQNQMYGLWALCRGCAAVDRMSPLERAEDVLDYTVSRRMQQDGGIIWEDVAPRAVLTGEALDRIGLRPPHWKFLYSCHQTFFVNAVMEYYRAGGTKSYDRAVEKALHWIFGGNRRGEDLVERSGIGVPIRQMTTDGDITVPDQMYVGTYEVGSYIMALTNLLDSPAMELQAQVERETRTEAVRS